MGIKTVILDDHDSQMLPADTAPLEISIGQDCSMSVYLSPENQLRLETLIARFLDGDHGDDGPSAEELVAECRQSLEADQKKHDRLVAEAKQREFHSIKGHHSPRPRKLTREENLEIDEQAASLMRLMQLGEDFELVADRQHNDRVAQAINNASGEFSGLKGFRAKTVQIKPVQIGLYGKPLIDVYAKRVS